MGVDYRVDIVASYGNATTGFAEHIMTVKVCGMAQGFEELFDKSIKDIGIEFYPNINGCDSLSNGAEVVVNGTSRDCYGSGFKVTGDIAKVKNWLREDNKKHNYRRNTILLSALNGFKKKDWEKDNRIIHLVLSAS